jgi:DNA polymerase I-like protein with 3'-5' exonuclease and polymerase domains
VDFPAIIRRFAMMQADIIAARPTELKSAVRNVRNGFIQQTETGISDVSDGVKRACAYAREEIKTKSFKIEKCIEPPLVDLCGRLAVRNVRTCPNPIKRVISEVSDFAAVAAAIRESGSVALDLETYGQRKGDGLDPWAGDIRLLSLCVPDQEPWILDLRAIGYDLGELKSTLEAVEIIAHNAKFDLLWLRVKCGLRATRVFCTLVAARLLSAGTKPGNDLDKCLERYLDIAPAPDHSRSDWGSMFLDEDQLAYAARDVLHLHALSNKLWGLLESDQLDRVGRLEFDLVPVIVEMENAGISVDQTKLSEIETKARSAASDHAGMLRQKLNLPKLNPGSPQQLLEALTAAGIELENTNEESLKAADDGEIIPLIIDFRGAEKLAQQAASLLECVKQDGRIHGRFDPTGTATGRFSSKDPNLQNIGRGELRTCFVPEPGNKLIVADYSQIELRAAAVIAGETKMIEAYKNGVDLHKQTASEVLGKPLDEVTKQDRQTSKACFSGDTEVLTPKGWVRFDQYDGRAEVAQYVLPEGVVWNPPRSKANRWGHPTGKVHWDAGKGMIEFTSPIGFQSFDDRELFQHEDRNTDIMVTADHQIVFISNAGAPRKVAASEVKSGNCRHFIAAGHLQGQPQPNARLELFTRSLAMVIADGYFSSSRCVRFGFSKQRKVERCLKLLSALGFHPKVTTSGRVTTIRVSDAAWVDTMRAWTQGGKDLSWSCLHQLPAKIYLEEAANWDSHVILGAQRDRAQFCTTSKQTAEVMQAMAALSGIPSQLSCRQKTNPKHKPTYRLSYVLRGPSTWRSSWNLKPTGRRERVWCVQVPSGAILIRRNGKVCVQGNCNFGLLYGQSAPGLVRYAASSYGVQMELDQAEQIRRQFFRTYGHLRQWHGESRNKADAGAYEVRTVMGRRRLIPNTASEWERFTALVNTPVQGGCADGMKQALLRIAQLLPPEARLISTVHDEVLVEVPEAMANEVRDLVQTTMIEAMAALFPQVPIEVEAGSCSNWGEK